MSKIIAVSKLPDDLTALSWVTDKLAVGTLKQVQNADLLRQERVDLLVCCRRNKPEPAIEYRARTRYFPLADCEAAPIGYFERPVALILASWQQGKRVLVYCAAGQSRSVTVAAVALVQAGKAATFYEAVDMIAAVRPQACPAPELAKSARVYLREILSEEGS